MLFPVIVKKLKTMEVSILIIRQERPEDYDTVYHVVKEAFENAEYTDGNEQNLVVALRKSKSFIPELSLVAVEDEKIVGHFPCTGMHGGKMFLRSNCKGVKFPDQVTAHAAGEEDMEELREYVSEFCSLFGLDTEEVLSAPFTVVTPDNRNPYRQLYVAN